MITSILSRCIILILGTLYPAYASYKAVRNKDVKDYLKWIMYWIVFAFFTCCETFTDIFLSWFPFYYELKVVIVIWLLSPVTEGSSVLYRNFVHPMLTKREKEIDEYINQAKEKGCSAVIQLGSKGVNYATNVIMQTALKSHTLLRLTSEESSSTGGRDQVDYSFEEMDEMIMMEEETNSERQSEHSSRHGTPFNDSNSNASDDGDFVEEATESFEEDNRSQDDEDDDSFDRVVKRGRGRPPKSRAAKMNKTPTVASNTRSTRNKRAASVRF